MLLSFPSSAKPQVAGEITRHRPQWIADHYAGRSDGKPPEAPFAHVFEVASSLAICVARENEKGETPWPRPDRMVAANDGRGFTSRERNLAMVIMQDALPGIKRFLKAAGPGETTERRVTGFIVAFTMHVGQMSATAASSAIRLHPRHRAQARRFLARDCRTRDLAVWIRLAVEHRRAGQWRFIVDQTSGTQQGLKTENT